MWGKHHSEETLEKLREASRGRKTMLGRKHTEEAKRKMREHNASRRPEVAAKISASTKGRIPCNRKAVGCYSKEGILIKVYESVAAAHKDGYGTPQVIDCCKGRRTEYKDHIFKYL